MTGFWQKYHMNRILGAFVLSVVLFVGYMHIYVYVFGLELPKTANLRRENAALMTRVEVLSHEFEAYDASLNELALHDNEIYRSIFGLNSISFQTRESGLAGESYERFAEMDRSGQARRLRELADVTVKKAFIQSKSFDEISLMLHTADNMATSVPAIYPILPDRSKFHISSPFGYRVHPVFGYSRMHRGMDFSIKPGNPVFATGDAVVEEIKVEMRGYGRQVTLNHGFGYQTRYAHLSSIIVTEGMKVRRGDVIAYSGNSGLSSGPHLHYEVIYKGKPVNPYHYFDRDMTLEEYKAMIHYDEARNDVNYVHPSHRKK